jgi:hypothetical protein
MAASATYDRNVRRYNDTSVGSTMAIEISVTILFAISEPTEAPLSDSNFHHRLKNSAHI